MSITDRSVAKDVGTETPRLVAAETNVRTIWRRYGPWAVTILNLSTFFVVWELFARAEIVNKLFLPRASNMFTALWDGLTTTMPPGAVISGSIRDHLFYSLSNLGMGVVIAIAIGVPFGLLMGANRYVDSLLSPYVWAISSMPRIALVPLFILFLGFTRKMQVTIIVLSAVFPIMINSWAGVKTTDKSLLSAAKVFGAGRTQLYTKVVFPFTLPFIISGIQQGIGRGLVGVIIAEIFGGSKGLGYLISRSADTFNSPLLYAVLFLLVVVSLSLIQFTRWLEAKVAPWRRLETL
ncbi:MAG TPA: ABC transporter permease [Acidimicrobiia bacterium]|nr:ABC transporter permease [Acidimicrobiia bacterium]